MLKPKLVYSGALLLGLLAHQDARSQQVLLLNKNQNYTAIDLSQVNSIVFADGHLKLNNGDCENDYYGLAVTELITFDLSAGVNSNELSETLSAFPNPADHQFTLTVPNHLANATAVLYTATGVEVSRWKLTASSSMVDLSNVASGIYYVRVNNSTLKLVKS